MRSASPSSTEPYFRLSYEPCSLQCTVLLQNCTSGSRTKHAVYNVQYYYRTVLQALVRTVQSTMYSIITEPYSGSRTNRAVYNVQYYYITVLQALVRSMQSTMYSLITETYSGSRTNRAVYNVKYYYITVLQALVRTVQSTMYSSIQNRTLTALVRNSAL